MPNNPKCYFGCIGDARVLHKFPDWTNHKHTDRFNEWKAILDADTKQKGNNYIFYMIRICDLHFEDDFKSKHNKFLTRNAVPTLNLTFPSVLSAPADSQLQSAANAEPSNKEQDEDTTKKKASCVTTEYTMWVLKACRACLTTQGKLEKIDASSKRIFSTLTGLTIEEGDGLPTYFCWECHSSLKKAMAYRRRARRAYFVMKEIQLVRKQVTQKDIESVNRKKTNLESSLGTWPPKDCEVFTITTPEAYDLPEGELTDDIKKALSESLVVSSVAKDAEYNFDLVNTDGQYNLEIKLKDNQENGKEIPSPFDLIRRTTDIIKIASILVDIKPANYKEIEKAEEEERQRQRQKEIDDALMEIRDDDGDFGNDNGGDDIPEDIDLEDVFKGLEEVKSESESEPEEDPFKVAPIVKKLPVKEVTKKEAPKKDKIAYSNLKKAAEQMDFCEIRYMSVKEQKERYLKRLDSEIFKMAVYKCAMCVTQFPTMESLVTHVEFHNKKATLPLVCTVCKDRFGNEDALAMHCADLHWYEYSCLLCRDKHYTLDSLMKCFNDHLPDLNQKVTRDDLLDGYFECTNLAPEDYGLSLANWTGDFKYKCTEHKITFLTKDLFDKHNKLHTKQGTTDFECEVCHLHFEAEKHLKDHMSDWHIHRYECLFCHQYFFNRQQARLHTNEHWSKRFLKKNMINIEMNKLDCNMCSANFKTRRLLFLHQLEEHRYVRLNTVAALNNPRLHCAACGVYFTSEAAHFKHMARWKHEDVDLVYPNGCKLCEKLFDTRDEFIQHDCELQKQAVIVTKTGMYPRQCAYCDEMLADPRQYYRHYGKQHPDLPYRRTNIDVLCHICGKQLNASEVPAHRRSHENQRPDLDCAYCPTKSNTATQFVRHMINYHTFKPYMCKLCPFRAEFRCETRDHVLKTHAPVQPYVCEACDRRFSHLDFLQQHCLKVHDVDLKKTDKSLFSRRNRGYLCVYPHIQLDGSLIKPETLEQATIFVTDYLDENNKVISYKDCVFFDPTAEAVLKTNQTRKKNVKRRAIMVDDEIPKKKTSKKKGKNKKDNTIDKYKTVDSDAENTIVSIKSELKTDAFGNIINQNLPDNYMESDNDAHEADHYNQSDDYEIKHEDYGLKKETKEIDFKIKKEVKYKDQIVRTNPNNCSNSYNETEEDNYEDQDNYTNDEDINVTIPADSEIQDNVIQETEVDEVNETEDVLGQLIEKDGEYYVLVDDVLYKIESNE